MENKLEKQLEQIDSMDGITFEHFCEELLKHNGFNGVCVTPASGDHGVDILAYKRNVEYAIQCKNYSGHVGNSAIQEAYTGKAYYDCQRAAVLTNNYFTESAVNEARKVGVELWDRDRMSEMLAVYMPDLKKYLRTKKVVKKKSHRKRMSKKTKRRIRKLVFFLLVLILICVVLVNISKMFGVQLFSIVY